MQGRRRQWAFGGATVIGAVAVIFLLLEAVARFVPPPRYHREPLQLDAELGFRGIPDFSAEFPGPDGNFEIRFNEQGFRGRSPADAADAADRAAERILFFGDSFLTGLGLRDQALVTARVERWRAEATGSPVEAFNFGIIDTGTAQQLILYELLGDRVPAETIVLALYPSNDLLNNSLEMAGLSPQSPGDPIRPYLRFDSGDRSLHWAHPLRATARRHSRLLAQVEQRLVAWLRARDVTPPGALPRPHGSHARLQEYKLPELWLELFQEAEPGSAWDRAWNQTFDLLRAFRDEARSRDARLIVSVIPNRLQVERAAQALALDHQTRRALGRPLARMVDWDMPELRLERFFETEGIEGSLLLEPLRAATRAGRSVYGPDGHLSEDGHAVWAEVLSAQLSGTAGADSSSAPFANDPDRVTGPVELLPPAEAVGSPLDLGSPDMSEALLGGGWGPRFATSGDSRGAGLGRWMYGRALVVVPEARGSLVLRGHLPAVAATLPLSLQIDLVGVGRWRATLRRAGPFDIEFAIPVGKEQPSMEGYIPLTITPLVPEGRLRMPLRIDQVGFAERPDGAL